MAKAEAPDEQNDKQTPAATCGVVMPIADFSPYPPGHWNDVLAIIEEAVQMAGFSAKLVSSEDAVGIIQQRIVQNLYENEIVVVDVSGKNPNVMFELGMRLTFDKPTVIIKDEITGYSFDTSNIEHLNYRSDLHYQSINSFKAELADKIASTHEAGRQADYSPFLKHFGRIPASKLQQREGTQISLVLEELSGLRNELRTFRKLAPISPPKIVPVKGVIRVMMPTNMLMSEFIKIVPPSISQGLLRYSQVGSHELELTTKMGVSPSQTLDALRRALPEMYFELI